MAYNQRLIDIEKINGEIFRSEQLLKDQVSIASNLEIEINLSVCTSNQLRKLINIERKDLDKIKVVVYEMVRYNIVNNNNIKMICNFF